MLGSMFYSLSLSVVMLSGVEASLPNRECRVPTDAL